MKYALPLGTLLCLPVLVQATHGHWIDHYRGTTWHMEVNGTSVVLPKKSVHLSEEPVAYWCHNWQTPCPPPQLEISSTCGRCLFVAVGG